MWYTTTIYRMALFAKHVAPWIRSEGMNDAEPTLDFISSVHRPLGIITSQHHLIADCKLLEMFICRSFLHSCFT